MEFHAVTKHTKDTSPVSEVEFSPTNETHSTETSEVHLDHWSRTETRTILLLLFHFWGDTVSFFFTVSWLLESTPWSLQVSQVGSLTQSKTHTITLVSVTTRWWSSSSDSSYLGISNRDTHSRRFTANPATNTSKWTESPTPVGDVGTQDLHCKRGSCGPVY